jgi:Protein of unknown function (DUF3949)
MEYIIIGSFIFIYILVMIPIQYRYIAAMKERQKKSNLPQSQLHEKMSFEEDQLHYNLQGSIINWPSAIIATLIYKIRHRHVH